MSRYIDADALIDFFNKIQKELGAERICYKSVNRAIDAMTTIDIVRCKECKWEWTQKCPPHRMGLIHDSNDFCSYGVRKESE